MISLKTIIKIYLTSCVAGGILFNVYWLNKTSSPTENQSLESGELFSNFPIRPTINTVADFEQIQNHCIMKDAKKNKHNQNSAYPEVLVEECLQYLTEKEDDYLIEDNNLPKKGEEKMLFHVFWHGELSDKIVLTAKSFLFSQPLENSALWIWIDNSDKKFSSTKQLIKSLKKNENAQELLPFVPQYINLKLWNTEEQVKNRPIFKNWENITSSVENSVHFSDMVRFVTLHNYGGVYLDADVLVLKDMRPLFNSPHEFAYQWSYLDHYNTAVLRLRKESPTAQLIIQQAEKNEMNFHPFQLGKYLKEGNNQTELYMLPGPLMDPLWLKNDKRQLQSVLQPNLPGFDEAFSPQLIKNEFPEKVNASSNSRKIEEFFPGSFAYHWHNNWKTPLHPDSWMGKFDQTYSEFLAGERTNRYGETINKEGEKRKEL